MRATENHITTLLVTDDPALECAARNVAKDLGNILRLLKNRREATCTAFDSFPRDTVAIVDVDSGFGSRCMIHTIAGLVPVVAVTGKTRSWVQSMVRNHRIAATVAKPVSTESLKEAVFRIRDFHGNVTKYESVSMSSAE